MPRLFVTTRGGEQRVVDAKEGLSVMEAIRDSGVDEILALCGGARSCATCHVFIDEGDMSRLSPAAPEELEMLDFSEHKQSGSRLACQIPLSNDLDGLKVTIAPDE
jgi:ferredoxin, 2Fe-2S